MILFIFLILTGYCLGTLFKGSSPYPLAYKTLAVFFAILLWVKIELSRPSGVGESGPGQALGEGMLYLIVSAMFWFLLSMALGAFMRMVKNRGILIQEKRHLIQEKKALQKQMNGEKDA